MHIVEVKTILSANNGMNIYRGCTHGCIYCDSRSKCYQINHDFEDVEAKENAPELLEVALLNKRNRCMIGTGSMSDPYNHHEETLKLTRRCLEVIERYGYGLAIQTKSKLILRDLDLLDKINKKSKCVVQITLTTFDEDLCRKVEPNVSSTKERFDVLMRCKELGIPTVVWLSPILPYLNDTKENLEGILNYCIEANVKGIICFGMGLTLREGNREYFYQKLDENFPGLKAKYLKEYGMSYEVSSKKSDELYEIFVKKCKENHIMYDSNECFAYLRAFPQEYEQLSLF